MSNVVSKAFRLFDVFRDAYINFVRYWFDKCLFRIDLEFCLESETQSSRGYTGKGEYDKIAA